ncbi:cytochrome P450 2B1-like [Ruditapes philippinarum]|uniref:cytochrome P450 2B1-like n=1 Tax=Ruditapes philippinarum TaxID=129788 RepID=UPI00295C2FD1|nr:cytochrome P450 2B1-like [Ruditapes philippinarum]
MDFIQLLFEPVYLLVAVIVVLSFLYIFNGKRYTNLPPGPKPLPIIGNIFDVRGKGALYEVALNLRQKYGDLVRLQLGPNSNVVLVMGQEKIFKAAVTMNESFKYRPTNFFVTNYIFNNQGLVFSNGDVHATVRKFTLNALRDFGVGKRSIEGRIQEEAVILSEVLEKLDGKPAYHLDTFKMAVANIIAGIVYGSRFEYNDPTFTDLIHKVDAIFKELSLFLPENFLPILRFLPGSKISKVFGIFKSLEKYAKGRIEEHRETFDPDNIRDFVDLFLKNEGGNGDDAINEANLFRLIVDLFNAGTDTTANTMSWAIIQLIKNPEVQKKCRKEILEVVGTGRSISLDDKKDLPYLQAFLNEVLRYSTIAPQTVPHSVIEDTEFEGYTIPKNSVVIFVLFTMLMDKDKWGDPDNFRPERFLSEKGEFVQDKEHFAPFSLGGRSCVGKFLAKQELFIFLGTLIQRFEFKSPPGSPPPSIRRIQTGITSQPEKYDICAVPY